MANVLFAHRIRSDSATLAAGSWEASLPLANLQDGRLAKVARSTNAVMDSTRLSVDLGASEYIHATGLLGHNLSLAALVRMRGHNYDILYEPPDTIATPYSEARTGIARYVDSAGVVQSAAENVLRNGHYEGSDRLTLLGAAYTNLVGSDDLSAGWTTSGTCNVTGSVADPAGGTSAYTVDDQDGAAKSFRYRAITFTGDAVKAGSVSYRKSLSGAATQSRLRVWDDTGSVEVWSATVTWTGTVPTVTEDVGTVLNTQGPNSLGYYTTYFKTTSVTAASDNRAEVVPADDATASTGSIDIYRFNAFDAPYPPRALMDASETINADNFKRAITFAPGSGYTLYIKIKNFMLANVGSGRRVIEIGNYASSGSSLVWRTYSSGDSWELATKTTAGGSVGTLLGTPNAPAVGSDYEFRVSVPATGDITWGVSKDGGTEATQTHTPGTWDSAFNSLFMYLGQSGAGANQGDLGLFDVKVHPDAGQTMAEMRTYDADSGWLNAYPEVYPTGYPSWIAPADQTGYVTAADYAAGNKLDHIYIPTAVSTRYWMVEINDTANADGYVDIGRLVVASGFPSSINFVPGASLGWETSSTRVESDGGAFFHGERSRRRIFNCTIENVPEDEAMTNIWELLRYVGTAKQLLFVYDPADTYHLQRRSFLSTLDKLPAFSIPYGSWLDIGFSVIEEL